MKLWLFISKCVFNHFGPIVRFLRRRKTSDKIAQTCYKILFRRMLIENVGQVLSRILQSLFQYFLFSCVEISFCSVLVQFCCSYYLALNEIACCSNSRALCFHFLLLRLFALRKIFRLTPSELSRQAN